MNSYRNRDSNSAFASGELFVLKCCPCSSIAHRTPWWSNSRFCARLGGVPYNIIFWCIGIAHCARIGVAIITLHNSGISDNGGQKNFRTTAIRSGYCQSIDTSKIIFYCNIYRIACRNVGNTPCAVMIINGRITCIGCNCIRSCAAARSNRYTEIVKRSVTWFFGNG
jgi:hypothetical protein